MYGKTGRESTRSKKERECREWEATVAALKSVKRPKAPPGLLDRTMARIAKEREMSQADGRFEDLFNPMPRFDDAQFGGNLWSFAAWQKVSPRGIDGIFIAGLAAFCAWMGTAFTFLWWLDGWEWVITPWVRGSLTLGYTLTAAAWQVFEGYQPYAALVLWCVVGSAISVGTAMVANRVEGR